MSYVVMMPLFLFLMSLYSYSSNRKHLLMMLMSLELMILSIFFILYVNLVMYDDEFYFLMMYLVFCVCESVLGLSILVLLIRTHGNDYFYSMNMLC